MGSKDGTAPEESEDAWIDTERVTVPKEFRRTTKQLSVQYGGRMRFAKERWNAARKSQSSFNPSNAHLWTETDPRGFRRFARTTFEDWITKPRVRRSYEDEATVSTDPAFAKLNAQWRKLQSSDVLKERVLDDLVQRMMHHWDARNALGSHVGIYLFIDAFVTTINASSETVARVEKEISNTDNLDEYRARTREEEVSTNSHRREASKTVDATSRVKAHHDNRTGKGVGAIFLGLFAILLGVFQLYISFRPDTLRSLPWW